MSDTNGTKEPEAKDSADEEREKATQTRDPELKAMVKTTRIMDELTIDQRLRLATWLYHRYVATPANKFFNDFKTEAVNRLKEMEPR